MKNVKNIIVGLILLVGIFINCNNVQVQANESDNKVLYEVSQCKGRNNGDIIEYSNDSWSYIDEANKVYEFNAIELGDWNFTCNSKEDLDKLISDYKNHYENDYVTDEFYIVEYNRDILGNKFFGFNDGSWASSDIEHNKFLFKPSITSDGIIEVNNEQELKNIVSTYKSIKTTGYY